MKKNLFIIAILFVLSFFSGIAQESVYTTQSLGTDLNAFPYGFTAFVPSTPNSQGNYGTLLAFRFYGGGVYADWRTQLAFGTNNTMYYRQSTNTNGTVWSDWATMYNSSNLNNISTDFKAKLFFSSLVAGSQISPGIQIEARQDVEYNGGWSGRISSSNSTVDKQVFLGVYAGRPVVGAHNFALNAWRDLYINTANGTDGGNVIIGGNVGIGTSGPNGMLHIGANNGDGIFIGKNKDGFNWDGTGVQPSYNIRFAGYRDAIGNFTGAKISALRTNIWANGGRSLVQGMELAFYVCNKWAEADGDGALSEALRIKSNGNVGIGSVNPDAKLTVNGTIHATEVKVDIAVPADYVFDPSYNLKPLSEVEAYVKAEKHLPEIPSAAEIKANGSNIGEMQNKLLQKIEELTLYMIEQQKTIAGQQNSLISQQAQIEELKKMVGENRK